MQVLWQILHTLGTSNNLAGLMQPVAKVQLVSRGLVAICTFNVLQENGASTLEKAPLESLM